MEPLTLPDHDLLARLIELNEDFSALAKESGRRVLDLYAWAAQPHIRAYIDFHREHARYLQERDSRKTLHDIVTTHKDPIERRRAATTLLRSLRDTPRPARKRSLESSADNVQTPPLPRPPAPPAPSDPSPAPFLDANGLPMSPAEAVALADMIPTLIREMVGQSPASADAHTPLTQSS